jgi:protein SCO1/2
VSQVALPDVSPEARGRPFPMRAAENAILLVFFGYTTCPDICPTTLATIRTALAGLDPADAARVEVAFVTVNLARDTLRC